MTDGQVVMVRCREYSNMNQIQNMWLDLLETTSTSEWMNQWTPPDKGAFHCQSSSRWYETIDWLFHWSSLLNLSLTKLRVPFPVAWVNWFSRHLKLTTIIEEVQDSLITKQNWNIQGEWKANKLLQLINELLEEDNDELRLRTISPHNN